MKRNAIVVVVLFLILSIALLGGFKNVGALNREKPFFKGEYNSNRRYR